MASKKRTLEEPSSSQKTKKPKQDDRASKPADISAQHSNLMAVDEIDFPRGGGTNLTALEVKATRAEGIKEANAELFDVSSGHLGFLGRRIHYRTGEG